LLGLVPLVATSLPGEPEVIYLDSDETGRLQVGGRKREFLRFVQVDQIVFQQKSGGALALAGFAGGHDLTSAFHSFFRSLLPA
jgi:hypothetical protein